MDRRERPESWQRRRGPAPRALACGMLLAVAVGCAAPPGWTETAFQHEVADAASTLRTAADLLEAAHTGRLTNAYVRGALVSLREIVDGIEMRLPELDGAPERAAIDALLTRLGPAQAALDDPCIDAGCDWRGQVAALRDAAAALLAAHASGAAAPSSVG